MYLKVRLVERSGIITCCMHSLDESLPVLCQCCRSFASVTINVTDMSDYVRVKPFSNEPIVDSKLLHEPITRDMLSHEPYTPESADSHSPNPEKVEEDNRRNSVSPSDLKNRLEDIIRTSQSPIAEIKRSVSQGMVVNDGGDGFRHRTMSETVKKTSRARLISSASVTSTVRLQSHHSSSGEEWFEFDENSNSRNSVKEDHCRRGKEVEVREEEMRGHTKDEKKNRCCCVLM